MLLYSCYLYWTDNPATMQQRLDKADKLYEESETELHDIISEAACMF